LRSFYFIPNKCLLCLQQQTCVHKILFSYVWIEETLFDKHRLEPSGTEPSGTEPSGTEPSGYYLI